MAQNRLQTPGETLDWSVDYSEELTSTSPPDAIATSEWAITGGPGSPGPVLSSPSVASPIVTVAVSGLDRNVVYLLTNKAVTQQGVTLERSLTIRCRESR